MNELTFLLAAAEELRRRQEPFLLATVVRVRGSAYRAPGARMLLTCDRWIAGSVSGGCLEGDVARKGWWRTEGGPVVVTYDAREDAELGGGFGLGCGGVVDVLLERGSASVAEALRFLDECRRGQWRGGLATVFGGGAAPLGGRVAVRSDGTVRAWGAFDRATRRRLEDDCARTAASGKGMVASVPGASTGALEALIEAIRPPPRLFVFGAGHDVVPVVEIAATVGWEVIVCEPHARFGARERFGRADAVWFGEPDELAARIDASDRALAIVMSHHYERDRATLDALLGTRALYIGMLGPRRRTVRMLDELGLADGDPRLHAPVGLDLGAETPQEIALAILAEGQAVLTQASATRLRERSGPIHVSAAAE
ncbi:MAG TPA: XdhC family protein [Polyangiaceae bacterium]|jgi:xanthine/CO dehydrogenase XdhC/CoxF family maturation factor